MKATPALITGTFTLYATLFSIIFFSPDSAEAFVPGVSTGARIVLRAAAEISDGAGVSEAFELFATFVLKKQIEFIERVETLDGSGTKFSMDSWGSGGSGTGTGGITRVMQGGDVVEKGAASVTVVRDGILSADRAAAISTRRAGTSGIVPREGDAYCAAALSVVLHSRSPMVPTFRSDVRMLLVRRDRTDECLAWYGGGADLTPYYLFEEDVTEFHGRYRDVCISHFGGDGRTTYDTMKLGCDDYFYLPARDERRGTGGIFFDDLDSETGAAGKSAGPFVRAVANEWAPSYEAIVGRRRDLEYGERQRQWQLLRRGRYLEFNLLYDRGVRFGLAGINPRVEGVMVSAPPLIAWEYNHNVEEGSDEAALMKVLKKPKKW
eukprot:CAMPEP_0194265870 /NCGR_PEP_ID=MMETSP0169-20130528/965_1 /TAXON_ID=218684 /ORGANISM="Corethron pennatum, Strain L29A3" /LENGTH=378 /DNA_ID=CAMNT_0039006431 /DNA_START=27 /DNA_END=1160 /DNA_ORIENTATION=-